MSERAEGLGKGCNTQRERVAVISCVYSELLRISQESVAEIAKLVVRPTALDVGVSFASRGICSVKTPFGILWRVPGMGHATISRHHITRDRSDAALVADILTPLYMDTQHACA